MFHKMKNPPQWMLDGLLAEAREQGENCPDCGSAPGGYHRGGCDVARCTRTGEQFIACDCGICVPDVWSGLWPGVQEAYDHRLVCFDDTPLLGGHVCFDLNEVHIRGLIGKKKPD